jgi:uncharacterized membrane protein YhiD involved in acid resistance
MDFSLDTLRDALLLGLIIMLVIVLYRRLLRFLGKDDKAAYASLSDQQAVIEDGQLKVRFHLPEQGSARIEIRDEGNKVLQVALESDELPVQEHEISIDISGFTPGKYSYHLITHNQQSQRFFTV